MAVPTVPTYDRYTFYRMLDQLGTDSSADDGKMNLNYDNLDPYIHTVAGITVTNPPSETNLMAWTPLGFFTNAADRMLRYYTDAVGHDQSFGDPFNADTNFVALSAPLTSFGVSQYPRVCGRPVCLHAGGEPYPPARGQSLRCLDEWRFIPSVFRPTFLVTNQNGFNNVYIDGYEQILGVTGANLRNQVLLGTPS